MRESGQSGILESTMDSSICYSNLDSGFQSLVGLWISSVVFWMPKPRISDSTIKNFLYSGIRIPFHGARYFIFLTLRTAKTHVITVWCGICSTNNYYYTRRQYFSIPSTKFTKFPQCVLPVSGLPVTLSRVIGFVRADVAPGSYS